MSLQVTTAPPVSGQVERYRVILAGMCALILTVGFARFGYTPLLPVMRAEAGLSAMDGGWLATLNYGGYISGALIASTIGDLRLKFLFYRIGLVVAVLSTGLMGFTQDVWLWAGLRFVSGMSSTAGLLLASGLVLNWLIRKGHKSELGLHFAGVGIGLALTGLIAEVMAGALSWDEQWMAMGLLAAVFFLPAWAWMPEPDPLKDKATLAVPRAPGRMWMWLLIAAYFCAGFGYVISATFIVAILEKLPLLSGQGNMIWIIIGLAALPSCFLWDKIARATGEIPALILAFVLEIFSILLPAFSDGTFANILGAVLYGGTFIGIVSLTLSLIGRCFPLNPAKAMARLTLSYGVAQILAPALAGYLATHHGTYRDSLSVAAWVMGAGTVFLLLLWMQNRKDVRTLG